MSKTLIESLLEQGYKKDDIFHHCSDLYIYKTPITTKVIDNWFDENKLNKNLFISTFKDNITGLQMYDVAFQYYKFN